MVYNISTVKKIYEKESIRLGRRYHGVEASEQKTSPVTSVSGICDDGIPLLRREESVT